jgi:hypothetical protein
MIKSTSPYVERLAAKKIVNFQNKAIQNKAHLNNAQPSLMQSNQFTTNSIELAVQRFIQMCQRIFNETEFLISHINHFKENTDDNENDPILSMEDVYGKATSKTLVEDSPLRLMAKRIPSKAEHDTPLQAISLFEETPRRVRGNRLPNKEELKQRINNYQMRVEDYLSKMERADKAKDIKKFKSSIRYNEHKLNNLLNLMNSPMNVMNKPFTEEDPYDLMGGATENHLQLIKVRNNLLYLLREADLIINTQIFPNARILNPIQKNVLRNEYEKLNSIFETIEEKDRQDLNLYTEFQKFLTNFNNIIY